MTWLEHHTSSSRAAAEAESAAWKGEADRALALYRQAAEAEEKALWELDPAKGRTLGITAVSAIALRCKCGDFARAKELADQLARLNLPAFASRQISEMVEALPGPIDRQQRERVASASPQPKWVTSAPTDQELVLLALKGTEEAFRALLDRYFRHVFGVIYHEVGDGVKAEELTKETFVRVFNNLDRYDPAYKFSSWISAVALRIAVHEIRQQDANAAPLETLDSAGSDHESEDLHLLSSNHPWAEVDSNLKQLESIIHNFRRNR